MGHEIDLKKYDIRTDLVIDTIDNISDNIDTLVNDYDGIKVTKVVVDDNVSNLIGKKTGKYITIEFDDVTDTNNRDKVEDIFNMELNDIFDISKVNNVLIIGLGNRDSTPDSLGPKVVDEIVVTRHLFLLGEEVSNGVRCSSIFSPGVMGNNGIETSDIISLLCKDIKPDLVIIVDALAASNMGRVNKCIQITDSGIHPGSGVGNMRGEISFDTLGVPVIVIGVPTVVFSSIIVYDTMDYLFKHISYIKNNMNMNKLIVNRYNYKDKISDRDLSFDEKRDLAGLFGTLSDSDRMNLINEVLNGLDYNFIVTPKEVDFQIDRLSSVISSGINRYIHDTKVSN